MIFNRTTENNVSNEITMIGMTRLLSFPLVNYFVTMTTGV